MIPTSITTHVADGLAHLTDQFRGQPNIQAIATAFLQEVQTLENAIQFVIVQRLIQNATGIQIDGIGSIVGQPRNGLDDATYKFVIQARIRAINSKGRPEDIIQVGALATQSAVVFNDNTSVLSWELTTLQISESSVPLLGQLLFIARALDTRGVNIYSNWSNSLNFLPSSVYGTGYVQDVLSTVYGWPIQAELVAAQEV